MILIVMFHKSFQSFMLCLYLIPVDYIDAKCLTQFQSRLGMVRPSHEVDFWFISLVIMYLMDSESYNKFWVEAEILG